MIQPDIVKCKCGLKWAKLPNWTHFRCECGAEHVNKRNVSLSPVVDEVNHPQHYKLFPDMEAFDVIKAALSP